MGKNKLESIVGFRGINPAFPKAIQPKGITTKASVEGFGKLNPVNTSNPKK